LPGEDRCVRPRCSLIRPWHSRRTRLIASPMDISAFCITPSGAAHHPSSPSPSSFYVIFSIPFVASMFSERASIVSRETTINTASSVTSVFPPISSRLDSGRVFGCIYSMAGFRHRRQEIFYLQNKRYSSNALPPMPGGDRDRHFFCSFFLDSHIVGLFGPAFFFPSSTA
jgi:hypothetical protein